MAATRPESEPPAPARETASAGIAPAEAARGLALPGHVRVGAGREVLRAIRQAGVNLAMWERRLPGWVAAGLAACPVDRLPRLRLTGEAARIASDLARGLDGLAETEPALAAWLAADLSGLAEDLAERARSARIVLRLTPIADDACRFFHADAVSIRLVTTYRGCGTQWLAQEDAARLGKDRQPPDAHVRVMPTGAVALFKGARAATPALGALMHRSPPRGTDDDLRLFLAIDPAPA